MSVLEEIKMEFIGTFLLNLFIGLASMQYTLDHISKVTYSIAAFTIYCILLWIGKHLSKSQYNPAISLFLIISGHISLIEGLLFTIVQVIASIFSAAMLRIILPLDIIDLVDKKSLLGFPLVSVGVFQGIFLEAIAVFFLVFGFYMFMIERRVPKYVYAPGIAGIFFFINIFMINKTGACFNPARHIGLAIIGDFYHNIYIFIVGPLLGGIVGSLLANLMLTDRPSPIGFNRLKSKRKKGNKVISERNVDVDHEIKEE